MKRLKRSLSLRSSRRRIPESHRPQVWENDSYKVRNGGVSFPVKYVGAIEVTESRGTQVCAEAFRKMREAGVHKKKRMNLLVTSDCIRVVDEETKSLTIDQTIEKVSFCTPDPSDDRVFSYICREGTTRRWMCHCFIAIRDTGERLSHAVGCAFTACLQRKQKAQALQQQAKAAKEGEKTDGTQATSTAPSTAANQQQSSRAFVSTPSSVTSASSVVNGPTETSGMTSSPSSTAPVVTTTQQVPPALKPPPAAARSRPQPFAPSPFTRHMSLRYRSTPMSLTPLKDSGKAGYSTLLEDPGMAPKLPPAVDALGLQSSPAVVPESHPVMQPNASLAYPQMQAAPLSSATVFNGMHPTSMAVNSTGSVPQAATPLQPNTMQYTSPQANQWPAAQPQYQPHGRPLERKVSDAEKWLASAEGSTKESNSNQGLLATHNPFAETAAQISALSSAWTQDMNNSLPAASQSNGPWGSTGMHQVREDDEFASLATRRTGSPLSSPGATANPFNKGSNVYWV